MTVRALLSFVTFITFAPFVPFVPFAPFDSFGAFAPFGAFAAAQPQPQPRVISLVPAMTDMLLAMGARDQIAAVSSYDIDPQVAPLPRVGALIDPDVERIIALKPTLVLLYGSQTDLITQLQRASIPYYEYRHGGLANITRTIRDLGSRVGRVDAANALALDIEKRIGAIRARISGRPKPRTLLVFGRERESLRNIYASGGRGFLHEMLEAAGGVNVFADVQAESIQASSELILTRAPEVIIELRSIDIPTEQARSRELASWTPLAGIPAVRNRRVYLISGKGVTVPGPNVAAGTEQLVRLLHPEVQ